MKISVLSLFPDMVRATLSDSILKRAIEEGKLEVSFHQIRDYSEKKHKKVDDSPYGGGSGMVMYPDVLAEAIKSVSSTDSHIIYFSPRGEKLEQKKVIELSKNKDIVMLCGHYEGIDQRFIDTYVDEEISIGDYVLTGGELPCAVTIDAISRHLDGVLGSDESLSEESFTDNLLEYPQYTRPAEFEGIRVPEVLLSGHHENIDKWRYKESLEITYNRRKDLFYKHIMDVLIRGDKKELKNLSDTLSKIFEWLFKNIWMIIVF